jgi:HCOMODA/2-hydroxy-3-carboxy-muconic semialdehyde decarboxylase
MPVARPDPGLVDKIVQANRILYQHGIVDGLGHVSARHDSVQGVYLLSSNRAPGLVRRRDIVCYDYDGNAVSDGAERPYLERFIHGEIYRARPDVVAVVHSHSQSVLPFAVTKNALKPVFHMSGFLGKGSAHYEIRDAAGGDSDMLIRDAALGRSLAQSLGSCSCVLMRGHGSTVVATASVEQVVYRAIYAEINAKLQLQAHALGPIQFLTEGEAQRASDTNDSQIPRSWNLWVRNLGDVDLDN